MSCTPFRLALDAVGASSIEIDGQDVADQVHTVELVASVGSATTLILHRHADGVIEGEGIVQVAGPMSPRTAADAVRVLDPERVHKRAMAGLGMEGDVAVSYLAVIAAMIEGG